MYQHRQGSLLLICLITLCSCRPTSNSKPEPTTEAGEALVAEFYGESLIPLVEGVDNPRRAETFRKLRHQIAAKPDDLELQLDMIDLLSQVGFSYYRKDQREKANTVYRAALKAADATRLDVDSTPDSLKRIMVRAYYNGACALASRGECDSALTALQNAVTWGFDEFDMLLADEDLESVRDNPEFPEAMTQWKALVRSELVQSGQDLLARGRTFPFDFSVTDLDGNPLRLADFRGKVVLVDCWATWCGPCLLEIPHFTRLQDEYGPRGLQMIGLSFETTSGQVAIANVRQKLEELNVNYPCAMGTDEIAETIPKFETLPTTICIDRTGKVRVKLEGSFDYPFLESIVAALVAEDPEDVSSKADETP